MSGEDTVPWDDENFTYQVRILIHKNPNLPSVVGIFSTINLYSS
jgi:hypothetical protein